MHISRFQLINYKSFLESKPVGLTQGFNIISGQNNAGKTALLEGLGLTFQGQPHRSLKTVPSRDAIPDPVSIAEVSFTLPPRELKEMFLASGLKRFNVTIPEPSCDFARTIGYNQRDPYGLSGNKLIQALLSERFLTFTIRAQSQNNQVLSWAPASIPTIGAYRPLIHSGNAAHRYSYLVFEPHANGDITPVGQTTGADIAEWGIELAPIFQRHVYRFTAERMNVGRSIHGANSELELNASNLPEVLNLLQQNPSRFRELNHILTSILPQVKWVSVRPPGRNEVEIIVWPHDPETKREDLAVPLSESGTGIGQVLAILYVVMTSVRPQVIIIDEPQSFLHPGAARKLIEFLKMNAHHQFVISTHSPAIISAANPRTITLVRYEGSQSVLQQLDAELEKGIQTTLAELGVRISDSFGADNILWVEGQTEEFCFRLIIERLLRMSLRGTEILGIRQTGDLEGRDAKRVFEIYRRLSASGSLLPPALAFILDQECRDENAKQDIRRLSGDSVTFLPRRMYENFLLNHRAITAVANATSDFSPAPLKEGDVQRAIETRLGNPRYYCSPSQSSDPDRIKLANGSQILKDIFRDLSETRVEYQKVLHGVALTEWIIQNSPEDLAEVTEIFTQILQHETQ